ncbi:hypothetical protein [Rummeliibacillus suwonensis]|uniref:hypothetical protein n=1 Tax=Rummeliibacillus suwonensis TaxID=1306154 RepID=UPI0011B60BF3|nr:hypothetical protein [Rummeliibacillus suwonensis]
MKNLKVILSLAMGLTIFSVFGLTDASAKAGWQDLGTWKMKSVVPIYSDGGNLKACVQGTDKVTFNLARDIGIPLPGEKATTSGSSTAGKNCANWSGLSSGAYNLHKDNYRTVYHFVTVFD